MDIKRLESRLRSIMRAVNDIEKATGIGGALAETVQEQCNAIAKDAGISLVFGLGGENPVTSNAMYTAKPAI